MESSTERYSISVPGGTSESDGQGRIEGLRPIGTRASILYFGIPALGAAAGLYLLRPQLEHIGWDPLSAYLASSHVVLLGLLLAALAGYAVIEKRPLTRASFVSRMRYTAMTKEELRFLGLIIIGSAAGSLVLTALVRLAADAGVMPLPANLPALLDPRNFLTVDALDAAAGGQIVGRWDIAALYIVTFAVNIVGEELWWRGYILPRQQLRFADRTWLIHGLFWAGFHLFAWWNAVALVPMCLLIAYASQRLRNNWPALIAHAVLNAYMMVFVLAAIA
jgi:membrane protease YdiL (CAAX protease family)